MSRNAKKCDICGTLYESYNTKQNCNAINGYIPINLDDDGRYYSHGEKDLCPECLDAFTKLAKELKGETK